MGWIDILIIALLGLGVLLGFKKGLVQEIVGVIALGAAFFLAMAFHRQAAGVIGRAVPALPPYLAPTAGFVALFLASFLAITVVGWLMAKVIKATPLDFADKIGGMAVGLVKGALVISILLLLMALVPLPRDITDKMDKSAAIRSIRKVAPWVYQNTRGLWPKAQELYQDWQKAPAPKKVQDVKPI